MAEKEPIPAHCRDALLEERDRRDRRFIPSGLRVPPQGARGNGLVPPCLPTTPCSSLATSSGVRLQSARERFRANVVHQSLLGPIPKYTRLPVLSLLMAILTLCQIPKLSAGFGI